MGELGIPKLFHVVQWRSLAAEHGLLLAGARRAEGSLAADGDALGLIASLGADSAAG